MDMNINGSLIRNDREKKAWSQNHLAKASGLGLRTIQRIESSGSASFESALAIASSLEIDVNRLRLGSPKALNIDQVVASVRNL